VPSGERSHTTSLESERVVPRSDREAHRDGDVGGVAHGEGVVLGDEVDAIAREATQQLAAAVTSGAGEHQTNVGMAGGVQRS